MASENQLSFRTITKIEEVLDNTPLSYTNFNIVTSDETILLITSKISPDYFFEMKKGGNFSCVIQPGEILSQDRTAFSSVPDSYNRIRIWAEHVADDVRIRQERLERDRLIKTWDTLIESKYSKPDQPLDFDDFEKWKKIVSDLQDRVADLEKKGVLTEEQAANIISEGEAVERQSSTMPGLAWMRKAGKYLVWVLKYVSQDPEVHHSLVSHIETFTKELPAHIETAKNALEAITK
jgi:hypothetical protein